MVGIPAIKMVMHGGWFIIAIPTLNGYRYIWVNYNDLIVLSSPGILVNKIEGK